MKKLIAAAALVALLAGCTAAQRIQMDGERYFRVFHVLEDNQSVLVRRCTKMTDSGMCVGEPVLIPAPAGQKPAADDIIKLENPQEDGMFTLQLENGQKKTVRRFKDGK